MDEKRKLIQDQENHVIYSDADMATLVVDLDESAAVEGVQRHAGDPVRTVFDDAGLESAEHWEKEADAAEKMAAWNRDQGWDLSTPGSSPGDHKAKMYRATARRLRLEAETGKPHCSCHESPTCPLGRV